jgi:hypothetical protein
MIQRPWLFPLDQTGLTNVGLNPQCMGIIVGSKSVTMTIGSNYSS